MSKFLVNQRIKVITDFNTTNKVGHVGFVERIDPADRTLTHRIRLDSDLSTWEWVREVDIEPETIVPVGKTLAEVAAEVTALDAQEAAANTTLASIAEHREKLLAELQGFGLTLIAVPPAPPARTTMGELYEDDAIQRGDVFKWVGSEGNIREFSTHRTYTVLRVDSDESVLISDDQGCDDWAWKNEGVFPLFIKAA